MFGLSWGTIALIWVICIPINYWFLKFDFCSTPNTKWTSGLRIFSIFMSLFGPFSMFNNIRILFAWLNRKCGLIDWDREVKW